MAVKSRSDLTTFINNNIAANGANAITGTLLNTILQDLIDSCLNLNDDSTSLADDIYRTATVAVVSGVREDVVFSSALSVASYQIVMSDTEGVGFENIIDVLTTGFTFTPLGTGNITYFAIINN